MTIPTPPTGRNAGARKIRWWPAVVVLVFASAGTAWFQWLSDDSQQHRNLNTLKVCLPALLLLLVWCAFFSRLARGIRLVVPGLLLAVLAGSAALLRIRGVTGDLLPVFEWRWAGSSRPPAAPEPLGATPPPPGPDAKGPAAAIDGWPQFLGPQRDATLPGPRLARDWARQPPRELWRRPVGTGWSGFAVARGFAVTQEQQGTQETVAACEAATGRPLWSHRDAARYYTTLAGEGPRATPSIQEDRVYALGATGILNCLDLATGKLLWTRQVLEENEGSMPQWGLSASPLLVNGLVVVSVGGTRERSLVAYDQRTGQPAWSGGHDRTSYSSPVCLQIHGAAQILIYNSASVAGHDPASGRLLWEYPRPSANPNVAVPVLLPGNRVLVSSGYGVGGEALELVPSPGGGLEARRLWKSSRLRAKFTNLVFHEGYVYGLDDGTLVCFNAETGEQKWKHGRYGHGQLIRVGKLLLVMAENGEVVLLEPVPEEHRELGRFTAFKTKTWNPPALAGEHLIVRNDLEAACFRLPAE